jgi:hypothetical protein
MHFGCSKLIVFLFCFDFSVCCASSLWFTLFQSCFVLCCFLLCCSNVVLVVVFFLVAIYGVESILCYLVWKWCWWSFGTTMKASVWSVWMWHAKVWGIYRGVFFRTVRLLKLSLLITWVCILHITILRKLNLFGY